MRNENFDSGPLNNPSEVIRDALRLSVKQDAKKTRSSGKGLLEMLNWRPVKRTRPDLGASYSPSRIPKNDFGSYRGDRCRSPMHA